MVVSKDCALGFGGALVTRLEVGVARCFGVG